MSQSANEGNCASEGSVPKITMILKILDVPAHALAAKAALICAQLALLPLGKSSFSDRQNLMLCHCQILATQAIRRAMAAG